MPFAGFKDECSRRLDCRIALKRKEPLSLWPVKMGCGRPRLALQHRWLSDGSEDSHLLLFPVGWMVSPTERGSAPSCVRELTLVENIRNQYVASTAKGVRSER